MQVYKQEIESLARKIHISKISVGAYSNPDENWKEAEEHLKKEAKNEVFHRS